MSIVVTRFSFSSAWQIYIHIYFRFIYKSFACARLYNETDEAGALMKLTLRVVLPTIKSTGFQLRTSAPPASWAMFFFFPFLRPLQDGVVKTFTKIIHESS